MNLKQTYQAFLEKKHPNGEAVSRRVLQLFDYYLTFEQPAADNVIYRIITNEESLLHRNHQDIETSGSSLQGLRDALGAASDEEWQVLVAEHNITPLTKEERMKVFQFESGLLGKDFTEWVLGNENQNPNKERK